MNLTELLDKAARSWPDKAALIEEGSVVSYKALVSQVDHCASKLRAFGLNPGSRVGLCFPNGVSYVALTFALWRLGTIVVPVPVECPPEELSGIANTMELEGILTQKKVEGSQAVEPGCFFARLNSGARPDNHHLNIAFIRFTSGTTSASKGVVVCHETVRDRAEAANKGFRIGPEDTVIWCLPMSHHFLITIVLYLGQGATIVLARHVLARPFLDAINRWKGTVLYAAPFHYGLLAHDHTGQMMDSVRLAVSTTCALPQQVAEAFFKRYNRPLTPALGIIECGLVSLNVDDPRGRWNSVGRPVPGFRVRILSADENGCGEVAVNGPGMFDAYAAPWAMREQVLRDGWFITGDLGRLDADGYLFLAGRKTTVINLAGRKVFPEEIEAVLNRHPAIRESLVYGRQHPHLGEVVEANLVLVDGQSDLDGVREFCRTHLASYEIPTRFNIVTALPRTAVTGKLRRTSAVLERA